MTPTEKLKQKWLHMISGETLDDHAAIQARLEELSLEFEINDNLQDLRSGGTPTGLQCEYSRNYSSKAVAMEMLDGSWVGWTYFFGGGKHGEPSEMPWMEDAYDVATEVVMEPVRKFRRIGV